MTVVRQTRRIGTSAGLCERVGCFSLSRMGLVHQLIELYRWVVIAAVLLSWIQLSPDNPVVRFVDAATEPVLRQLRRVIPPLGGFDLSPLVLLIGLSVLSSLL